jgi:hypothetical protein
MASKEPVAPEKTTREDKPTFHAVLNEFLRRIAFLSSRFLS